MAKATPRLHFIHRWTKWAEGKATHAFGTRPAKTQERTCQVCGWIDRRWV